MRIGTATVTEVIFGQFRLDGGSMFGSVPKNLWSRSIAADDENCIPLMCRSLLIEENERKILVDVGMGDKWTPKMRQVYGAAERPRSAWGFDPSDITDVILTHLHFDHAGGITFLNAKGELELTFPNATIHLQVANWRRAQNPTVKDRASYLPENIEPLKYAKLTLCDGDVEILPSITVHRVDGHTPGQQWIEIHGDNERLFFATDLIPTAHHLPLPYHMGYDVCAETLLPEKDYFLQRAVDENAIVCFQHDVDTCAVRLQRDDKGRVVVREKLTLS